MFIKFKVTNEIPVLHFDVLKLLLPSHEKKTKVLGRRTTSDREELERSRKAFGDYTFVDTVIDNFKKRRGINLEDFLSLYAPGFRKEVREILEKKGFIGKKE
jgi:hypothetical protein